MNSAIKLAKSKLQRTHKVKAKIALVSSALLLAFSAHSAEKNYDNLHKQLDIMNNIMLSSAKVGNNADQPLIRSIESIYLKGQGAIFTVKSSHGSSSHRQFFQMVAPKAPVSLKPPKAPKAPVGDNDFVIEFSDHEDEFERVIEMYEIQREGARELHSEQREIAYEIRDVARQAKDIEFQLQRAEKEAKKQLTAELKKLDHEREALNKNKVRLEQKVVEFNKQREQQKLAQDKAKVAHFNALNTSLIETLCLYGNGLQAVPSDEHVSLIIKGAGDKQRSGYKDNVFVINKKDISACANGKLSAKKLLAKAAQYQF